MRFWYIWAICKVHAQLSSGARGQKFGMGFHLLPYFVYRSNDLSGSSEPLVLAHAVGIKISCTGSFV